MAWPVAAQVKYGDLSSNLDGTISAGYTADYGNMVPSDHSLTLGGTANLSGNYYSPNFLSYVASVYLNQSRANSEFQSISNASGASLSADIFGGSRFPGAVSYARGYNSDGNYGIPGISNYVTHGNNDELGIAWGLNLPNKPSLSAGFQMGNNNYSVYGSNSEGNSAFHNFNLHSSYHLDGFNMSGFYSLGATHSLVPEVVSGEVSAEVHSDSDGFGFGVSHRLPLQGSMSFNVNRSSWNTNYAGVTSSGTIDTTNLFAAIHPAEKLTISGSAQYSDNLTGQLFQSVIAAGGVIPGLNSNESSDSLDLMAVATYVPMSSVQTSAFVERRAQSFQGQDYGINSYGGSANYTHKVPGGMFSAAVTASANSSDNSGEDTLGFSTSETYSSEFLGWHVSGSFSYAQNMQTLLVTYMNSSYSFSGNARRRFGKLSFSAGGGGSRTALTDQPGTASSGESYSAGLGYSSWINANGSYSKSSGQALATGAGLVPVPVPTPVLPSSALTLYGGDSYSGGISSAPIAGLSLSTSFSRSNSNTSGIGLASANQNEQYNALIEYRVRKLGFVSGYARLEQGFGGSGTQPEIISSYYAGLTRWFKFF